MGDFFSPTGLGTKLVSGIVPSAMNMAFSAWQQNKQNQFNREQIREQNEYNSPSATMNRMIAAGISPKAAQESIAGVPTLGEQSSVATAAPPTATSPGTDFMSGLSSAYANDLVSSQAQSVRATDELNKNRFEMELRESNQRIQESISNMKYIDSKTLTEDMLRLFRRQEQPYQIKLLEQEVILGEVACAGWNSMTYAEKRLYGFRSGQSMLSDAEYKHKKSKANVDNFEFENKAAIQRFKFEFDSAAFGRKEIQEKTRVLHTMYDSLLAGFEYDLEAYGWSKEQIQHTRTKKSQIFKNFDLNLDNEGLAGLVLNKSLRYQNLDNKGVALRSALGLASQLFDIGMTGRNFLPLDPKVKTGFKFFDD